MNRHWFGFAMGGVLGVAAALGACGGEANFALSGESPGGGGPGGNDIDPDSGLPRSGSDGGSSGNDGGAAANDGIPCAVQKVLNGYCLGACHTASTTSPLRTYADLQKPAPSDTSKTLAQKSVERMKAAANPMPPSAPKPTSAEIAAFESWVTSGAQKGASCGPDAGLPDAGSDPYNTPTQCSSKSYWLLGNRGSSAMRPGGACNDCHRTSREGPIFALAGTVYKTAHEPNDCNGVGQGAVTVVVTDKNGKVTNLLTNPAGNFYMRTAGTPPYSVKVVANGKERAMVAPVTAADGDCNTCHTEKGANKAPGRIMAP